MGFAAQGIIGNVRAVLPKWMALPIGAISGIITGAFVSGGPPLILFLYSQVRDPREMKATVQALFILSTTYRLILVLSSGPPPSVDLLLNAVVSLLFAVPILYFAHRLSTVSSATFFSRVAYTILGAFGVVMLSRAF